MTIHGLSQKVCFFFFDVPRCFNAVGLISVFFFCFLLTKTKTKTAGGCFGEAGWVYKKPNLYTCCKLHLVGMGRNVQAVLIEEVLLIRTTHDVRRQRDLRKTHPFAVAEIGDQDVAVPFEIVTSPRGVSRHA